MENTQTKTVIEWLEQAKADGYPWAQSAINQVDKDKYMQCNSLSHAVGNFAYWEETKEGRQYWDAIQYGLIKKGL